MIITIPCWLLWTLGIASGIVVFLLAILGVLFLVFLKGYKVFPV